MCIDPTERWFVAARNEKFLIFRSNLCINRGPSVLLFILNCKWHDGMTPIYKISEGFKCSGEVNKTKISATYLDGQFCNLFFSKYTRITLFNVEPKLH